MSGREVSPVEQDTIDPKYLPKKNKIKIILKEILWNVLVWTLQ